MDPERQYAHTFYRLHVRECKPSIDVGWIFSEQGENYTLVYLPVRLADGRQTAVYHIGKLQAKSTSESLMRQSQGWRLTVLVLQRP
jgi:hypothetical protein